MKLLRVGPKGQEIPAILDSSGTLRDARSLVTDWSGEQLHPERLEKIAAETISSLDTLDPDQRIGPCIDDVGKFICIGLNYADHAAETGAPPPEEPVLFFKATSAICGPNDDLIIPRESEKTDWEVELGVVIGKDGVYIPQDKAHEYIAGYCIVHDVSERSFQLEGTGQWVKGKSADTFGPIGPYLVTPDEVDDPQNLPLWLDVDGEQRQRGSTSTMIFPVDFLIHYISKFMSLQAGDIISTGTPPGVGLAMSPPRFLRSGNIVTLGIDGLGEQRQTCVNAD